MDVEAVGQTIGMGTGVDQVAVIAVHAGQVLLSRVGAEWRLPRGPVSGDPEATLDALIGEHRLEVQSRAGLGTRSVDGVTYEVHRLAISGLPSDSGLELRLVRLAQLPKEFGSPDRELLDLLLGGAPTQG